LPREQLSPLLRGPEIEPLLPVTEQQRFQSVSDLYCAEPPTCCRIGIADDEDASAPQRSASGVEQALLLIVRDHVEHVADQHSVICQWTHVPGIGHEDFCFVAERLARHLHRTGADVDACHPAIDWRCAKR